MLQQTELGWAAHGRLVGKKEFPPPWQTMEELEKVTDEWVLDLWKERTRICRERGRLARLVDAVDRKVRTEEVEYLDQPDFPAEKKVDIVQALHMFNLILLSYRRYIRLLTPMVRDISAAKGRPARILELASGSGELTFELARLGAKKKLPLTITGSDYIPEYVERGKALAKKRGLNVDFRLINAFDMKNIEPGEFDILLISQTIHHFSPGQLAMMVAQAKKYASTAFVGFDGKRGPLLLFGLPVFPALTLKSHFVHDAWITARRLFSEVELDIVARIAAAGSRHWVATSHPAVSVLTVRFDS